MRAAIYVRISRDRVGAGLGVERQEQDCRELAAQLGHTVTEVYADNDLSAYSGKPRPAYRRLLADIAAGRTDVVLAWHTDRLHRSPSELEEYIAICDARRVPTHTAKAGVLDLATPSGRLVARQLGAVARYEVEHQVERQRRAKLQAAASGRWGGGRRPYGYEADGCTIREAEATVLREVIDSVLTGSSLRAETARLNAAGLTTSTGRAWQPTELRRVLMRARNAGLREHRGAIQGEAEWPALVNEEKWRAVCSVLADPARRTSYSTARKWLLSNLAVCGVCAAPLRVTLLATTRRSIPSYTCNAGKHVVRNAAELEAFVNDVVIDVLSRPDAVERLRPSAPEMDVAALRAGAAAIRQRLDDLADDLGLDERVLSRRTQALQARLDELEQQLADAGRGSVFSGLVDAPDVAAAWAKMHLDRRRAVIDGLMTVVVHRAGKGRRRGWKPGESYFDPRSVEIRPKDAG